MNSKIYISKIWHERLKPRKNSFKYSIYMMYLDLDELEVLNKKFFLFSYNKWNVFSFYNSDHFKFLNSLNKNTERISREKVEYEREKYIGKNTKERIRTIIGELKLDFELDKVFVLTNLRNFGYIFNPVSFYYCFDKEGKFRALFSEVNNTFHDQKMYYIEIKNPNEKEFQSRQKKNYYISPFINYDNDLEWKFELPGEHLKMAIDSIKGDEVELKTLVKGRKREITNLNLLLLQLRYPFYTVMVIVLIHYQALKLWFKKVQFYKKEETDEKIVESLKNK